MPERTSPWERAVAALGAALVLGALGVLGWEAVARDDRPPALSVTADTVVAHPGGTWGLVVRVRNDGGETAAGVEVRGTIRPPGAPEVEAETTLDYVPGGGERRATLAFPADPRVHPPALRVAGYHEP